MCFIKTCMTQSLKIVITVSAKSIFYQMKGEKVNTKLLLNQTFLNAFNVRK